jgi:hypothetical protein
MSSGVLQPNGGLVATGSAYNVTTPGFRPRRVRVFNVTSGDAFFWNDLMPAGYAIKQIAAGTRSYVSSNGITQLVNGFTLGADGDVNAAGENLIWECDA